MELNREIVAERLKEVLNEATDNGSQDTMSKKLFMSQGNISKILKGTQMPTVDTLYKIAEECNISIDWLLGLSNKKERTNILISYGDILKMFIRLSKYGSIISQYNAVGLGMLPAAEVSGFGIPDEILKSIFTEWDTMSKMEDDLYAMWAEKRIKEYSKIPYIPWNQRSQELYNERIGSGSITPEVLELFFTYYEKND